VPCRLSVAMGLTRDYLICRPSLCVWQEFISSLSVIPSIHQSVCLLIDCCLPGFWCIFVLLEWWYLLSGP
jgi:hypothetical protein